VSGWIRRGPSGVIGTNKKDAQEVADTLTADAIEVSVTAETEFEQWRNRLFQHGAISKQSWARLDRWEEAEGHKLGRPRRKLLSLEQVEDALARQEIPSH